MSFWRTHPMFCSALIALGTVALAEAWWVCVRARSARRELAKLEQRRRDIRSLAASAPAPTEENMARIEQNGARLAKELADVERELGPGRSGNGARAPEKTMREEGELFFELTAFVAAMRDRASQLGIELREDERFGFAEYAHAGPASDTAQQVARECDAVQQVLRRLFSAGPKRLVRVERARRPEPGGESGERMAEEAGGGEDYFNLEAGRSVAVTGVVETIGLRLTFEGETAALRRFLREVGRSDWPLVVRAVEVVPVEPAEEHSSSHDAEMSAIPFVRGQISRFIVTLEAVRETSASAVPAE